MTNSKESVYNLNMQTKYKRKKYFLNKKFQGKYALILFAILISMLVLSVGAIYVYIEQSVLEKFSETQTKGEMLIAQRIAGMQQMRINGKSKYSINNSARNEANLISTTNINKLKEILVQSRRNILPILVTIIFIISFFSIFMSHKIAGPLYRLQRGMIAIKNKKLDTKIRLRKNDQLEYLVQDFNKMSSQLNKDIKEIKHRLDYCKKGKDVEENMKILDGILAKYKTN